MSRAKSLRGTLASLLGIALFLSLWWAATDARHVEGLLAPFSLSRTTKALRGLLFGREIWPHVAASLRRILLGLGISVAIGIPLGAAVGTLPLFGAASAPLFQFIRMVSPLAWTPLAIMLFGVGDAPVLFLIVIAGVWPIVLATSAAVASLDRRLTAVGRTLGGRPFEIARFVVWPSLRPQILTGIRGQHRRRLGDPGPGGDARGLLRSGLLHAVLARSSCLFGTGCCDPDRRPAGICAGRRGEVRSWRRNQ